MIGVFITQLIPWITKTYVFNSLEGSFELSFSLIKLFIIYPKKIFSIGPTKGNGRTTIILLELNTMS